MDLTSSFYEKNAAELAEQYNALDFETVHQGWLAYWPSKGASVLDVGAGSGRDAKWMSVSGCKVVAVEPSHALRELGMRNTGASVIWLDDSLPDLLKTQALSRQYSLILISAVWMHIPIKLRAHSFATLSSLLTDGGRLVVTLRHGSFLDGRVSFGVSVAELESLATEYGLKLVNVSDSNDSMARMDVTWQTVVLEKAGGEKE
ncbi:class I SAM-dependent methyltransferase [Vibrio taketomensis]|uniref:class I SAM-dependent methyltransferase n=1 Tax=Vibrio taketomensis TaxID=2572923 RepID=UPI001389AB40|nr:methyltransferase domain-containing protein [Vibrio taketomensis]